MSNIVKQPCDTGVINAKRCSTSCSRITQRWVLVTTILGSSMVMIDGIVVNITLPVLQQVLNATATQVQWVVESYALFLATLILLGGSLGDKFGRRLIYACGIALFALASVWCALSPNIAQLIIARAFQGIGGALLIPGSLAIISASFADNERRKAIKTWSNFTAIVSAFGLILGGWLLQNLSWRWIFFINVPLAIAILSILFSYVPESRDRDFTRLDYSGAMLATLGLGVTVFGLIESSNLGLFHPLIIGCLVSGMMILGGFIFVEQNIYNPMIPLSLFKSPTFSGANLLTLLLYSAWGGVLYFIPFNLIQVQGYSLIVTSAVFLPFILIIFSMPQWSYNLVNYYGIKLPLIIGPLIAAVGFILLAIPGINANYWITFFPAIVVLALGMKISIAPLTKTLIVTVRQSQTSVACGINNTVSRIAGLIAIAIFNIFVFNAFNYSLDKRLAKLNLSDQIRSILEKETINLAGGKIPGDTTISEQLKNGLEQAITLSYIDSFRLIMFIGAILALLSAVVGFLTINEPEKTF